MSGNVCKSNSQKSDDGKEIRYEIPEIPKHEMKLPNYKKHGFGINVINSFKRTCQWISRVFLIAFFIRALFEVAPELQNTFPKMYAVYDWVVSLEEALFKFVFGFIGSLLRGEMKVFNPKVWEGLQELFRAFAGLF